MDDAFAGGVCRCQYCGTIQTVPSHLKGSGDAPTYAGAQRDNGGSSKALYQQRRADGTLVGSGTGLDQLAEAVASSGLANIAPTGSGLSSGRMRHNISSDTVPVVSSGASGPQPKSLLVMLGVAMGLIVALLGIVIFLMVHGNNHGPATGNSHGAESTLLVPGHADATIKPSPAGNAPPHVATSQITATPSANVDHPLTQALPGEANFCGFKLDMPLVIYVVDRGQGTSETFDATKLACLNSIATLKPQQKFQLIFWSNGTDEVAFPESGPAPATPQIIGKFKDKLLDDVFATGQADVKPALQKAIATGAPAILLITGKFLADDFSDEALQARQGSSVKIHCLAIGSCAPSAPLKQIAQKTGGEYRERSAKDLMQYAN